VRRLSFDQYEFETPDGEENLELAISAKRRDFGVATTMEWFLSKCGASRIAGQPPSSNWERWTWLVETVRKNTRLCVLFSLVGCGTPEKPTGVPVAAYVRDPGAECFQYKNLYMNARYWGGWPAGVQCDEGDASFEIFKLATGECVAMPKTCSLDQASGESSLQDPEIIDCGDDCDCTHPIFDEQGVCPGQRAYSDNEWAACDPPGYPFTDCGYTPAN
jgi:hypothetical protein